MEAIDTKPLVNDWHEQGLAHRTIANRMVDIRWLAVKVNRAEQIPSNKDVGIGLRKSADGYGKNKALELDQNKLAQLGVREQLITELRRHFGLRTDEAVRFSHAYATAGSHDKVELKGSWTKGGKPRQIAIVTERQRDVLRRVGHHQLEQGDRSMIPSHRTLKSYYRDYNEMREAVEIPGHALRHQWAQERFERLSGIKPPLADGPAYRDLNEQEQSRWNKAAEVVNLELGHGKGRQDITATYIGGRG